MEQQLRLDEVERTDGAESIEVVTMWESTVLDVEHVDPEGSFEIGEEEGARFQVPPGVLGVARHALLADGLLAVPGGGRGELVGAAGAQPIATGERVLIHLGARARVRVGNFSFLVSAVPRAKKAGAGWRALDRRSAATLVGSGAFHLAFLLLFWLVPPDAYSLSANALEAGSRYPRAHLEPTETQTDDVPLWNQDARHDEDEGGRGKRSQGEEGQLGDRQAPRTHNRYGIKGPRDNRDPHMSREAAREQAARAGILGILFASSGSWNAPTSPFGRDRASGQDDESALGALIGHRVGPNFGYGGLELDGTGRGGGGTGEGTICLGQLATIGHGGGGGWGSGYGHGAGGLRVREGTGGPDRPQPSATVKGGLSKEVIRRVVRQHMNEIRFCYEQQLAMRPDLQGRVPVSFVISPSGAVQSSAVVGSTLGNATAEQCMARAVRRWAFPTPEGGGIVAVTYPFILRSADEGVEER